MAGRLIEKDHGWNALRAMLQNLRHRDAYVKVGFIGEKAAKVEPEHQRDGEQEPMTNVQLGVIHEFGSPEAGIPERSFIRSTFDSHREGYVERLRKLVKAVYEGKTTIKRILGLLGLEMEWDQKNAILKGAGIPPPLAAATIRAKERAGRWRKVPAKDPPRPLVDSGRLAAAISHAVVLEGGQPVQVKGSAYGTEGPT
jgi:hypothetical protein